MAAPLPPDESQRLEALRRYPVAPAGRGGRFDRITRMAAWTFDVPVALVTLIDEDRQHFLGCTGLDRTEGTAREHAFCGHTILADEVLVVEDAACDPRFADNPVVTGPPHLRFYAGAPLVTPEGFRLGSLCLIDTVPRTLSDEECLHLQDLAGVVVDELELGRETAEHRRAERARRASEARFRALTEHALDVVAILDGEAAFTFLSPSAEPTLGYPVEALEGTLSLAHLHEADVPAARATLEACLAHPDEPQRVKVRFRHGDGSWRHLSVKARNLLGHEGIDGILLNVRDVTERERREEQLRLMQSVVVHANDAVIITEAEPIDEPGPRIEYVNEAFCRTTGYTPEEVIGESPRLLQGPRTDRAVLDEVRERLEAWEPVRVELENYRKDGSTFWLEMVIVPVDDGNGWYTHWVSIQRDITERKRAEQLREEQSRLLERTAAGHPLDEVLHELTLFAERQIPGTRAAVLLLDEGTETLRVGAAPHLPDAYRAQVDGTRPDPALGPSTSALAERRSFFSRDLTTDERWPGSAAFARAHGLRACRAVPILDEQGAALGAFALYHDRPAYPDEEDAYLIEEVAVRIASIALERHRHEAALRRSEERYRTLVANLPGIVYRCTYDEQWRTLYMSDSFKDVLGYHPDEFRDEPGYFKRLVLEDDLPRVREAVRHAFETGAPFEVEYRIRHADGSVRWLYDVGRVTTDGAHPRIDGFMLDVTARHEQEERLRTLEKALHDATESVLITDAGLDRPGPRILYVNPGFERMTGYTAEEVIGHTPRLLQGEETDRALMDRLRTQLEAGERFHGETVNYRKDGTPFHIEWSISPVRDDAGRTTHYVAVQRDVTERKQAERELLRISTAVAVASDGIAIAGPDGRILYHNQALTDLVGYTAEEINALDGPATVYEDPAILAHLAEAIREGRSWTGEVHLRHREGRRLVVSMRVDGIRDPEGEPLGAIAVHTDVTERRRAEHRLRASEERYRSVVNNVRDVVFQTDADGHWTFLNPAWTDVTGLAVDATLGRPVIAHVHPEDRTRARSLFDPLLRAEEEEGRHEVRYRTHGGSYRWIEVYAGVRRDERGRLAGLSGTLHDVTERRRAMEALQQSLERERELSELKSRFVSMASHELRTPLATIQSSTELIERFRTRWEAAKIDKHLHRIQTNVQDMTVLLEDVLLLGRAGSDRLPFDPEPLTLRPFIENLVDEMQSGLGAGHRLVFEADDDPLEAVVDDTLLRLVFNNLLTNAIKYAPEGTRVDVRLCRKGEAAVLAVADRGIGIPEADLGRLFEPFHRAGNVGTRRGTGLGLSIVQRAVEMHGGRIDVDSRLGEGTTFTITLPLHPPLPREEE